MTALRIPRSGALWYVTGMLSLAVVSGTLGALFAILDALLLADLPGLNSDGLALVYRFNEKRASFSTVSYPEFQSLEQRKAFSDVAAFARYPGRFRQEAESKRVTLSLASAHYFDVLGTSPFRGRFFSGADDVRGAAPVAVLSYETWRSVFGFSADVVGRVVTLNSIQTTIIGITPEGFRGAVLDWHGRPDFWLPMSNQPEIMGSNLLHSEAGWPLVLGRLRPGDSHTSVESGLANMATRNYRIVVLQAERSRFWPGHRGTVRFNLVLLAAICLALVLAVVLNLFGLFVARFAQLSKEYAIRSALGATRLRRAQTQLAELVPMPVVGSGLGILVADLLLACFARYEAPLGTPVDITPALGPLALLLMVLLSLLITAVAAIAASIATLPLSNEGIVHVRGHLAGSAIGLHGRVISLQLGAAVVLLAGALALTGSVNKLDDVDSGFTSEGVAVTSFDLSSPEFSRAARDAAIAAAKHALRSLQGVEDVAMATVVPGSGSQIVRRVGDENDGLQAFLNYVSPEYFEALGQPFRRGRGFGELDPLHHVVVNETFAKALSLGSDPIGRTFRFRNHGSSVFTIVGVVNDAIYTTPWRNTEPQVILPFGASSGRSGSMFIAYRGPLDFALAQQVIASAAPELSVTSLETFDNLLQQRSAPYRLSANLAGALATVILLVGAVGIYGTISYNVECRRGEFGLRVACGAREDRLAYFVIRQMARDAMVPLLCGLLAAWAVQQFAIGSLEWFRVGSPVTFLAAVMTVLSVHLFTSWTATHSLRKRNPTALLRA